MKSTLLASLVLAILPLSGLAAVVTLSQVIPTATGDDFAIDLRPTNNVGFDWEAIGTASDGSQTTYRAEVEFTDTAPGASPTAKPFTGTLVASAGGYAFSVDAEIVSGVTIHGAVTCTASGNGGGCVVVQGLPANDGESSTTITTSFQGTIVPIATVTVQDPTNAPTQAQTSPGGGKNGALTIAPLWGVASMLGAMAVGAVVVL